MEFFAARLMLRGVVVSSETAPNTEIACSILSSYSFNFFLPTIWFNPHKIAPQRYSNNLLPIKTFLVEVKKNVNETKRTPSNGRPAKARRHTYRSLLPSL